MAIKHKKTGTIADWTQTDVDKQIALGNIPAGKTTNDIILTSDFNADHDVDLTGLIQAGTNITITGGGLNTPIVINSTGTSVSWGDITGSQSVINVSGFTNDAGYISSTTGDWTGTFDGQEGSYYLNRANHTGTQLASTISDFTEAAQDATGAMVDATLVYNDASNSLGRAAISGDITIAAGSNTAAISAGVIVDTDINAAAGILLSKTNISLTTTGTTGAATLNTTTGVLNIPNYSAGGGGVNSVSGTLNRITSTGGANPVIDISPTFEALLGKVASPLSQFAPTTSAQLASVLTDETGTGVVVFNTSPVLTTPDIGTAVGTALTLTNTISASNFSGSSSGTNTGDQTNITGNAGTATALQNGRTISITGDLAYTSPSFNGTANVSAAGTLATVNSNVGTFGSASQVAQVTVNGKGLTTAASNVPIQIAQSQVTNLVTDLAGKQPAGTYVTSVSGTTNRITSTGGTAPAIDISATFEATLGKVANPLSQFAPTTSAQLAGVISDETGSGSLVFGTAPTLNSPLFTGVAAPAYAQGKLAYDTDNESLTFFNNDSNVSLQVGQEEWIRVRNVSGSTIPNGSAVYLNGSSSGLPTIALAQSNAAATTICAGLTTESIANNSIGYVTCIGAVRGLDTSAFAAGQTVFVSSTVAGGLTATAPLAPNYRYRVGIVGVSSATVGTIHVTPSTAALGNGTANQLFGMNTAGTAQEVKSLVAGSNVTITPAAGSLTIAATSAPPQVTTVATTSGSSVSISVDFTNNYAYMFILNEISANNNNLNLTFAASSDGGGSYPTVVNGAIIAMGVAGNNSSGILVVSQPSVTGALNFNGVGGAYTGTPASTIAYGRVPLTAACNMVRFSVSSFDAGSISYFPLSRR